MSMINKLKILCNLKSLASNNVQKRFMAAKKKKVVKQKNKKTSHYVILRPSRRDYCEILRLMYSDFFPYEPITMAMHLGRNHNPVFDEDVIQCLKQGTSLVARCKYTRQIVGACINRSTNFWDADELKKCSCQLECPRTRDLYQFYSYVQKVPCLYEKYKTRQVFELNYLVVRRDDRGQGLGATLLNAGRKVGADCGFKVVRVDATSYYSAVLCEKYKMNLVHVIPYCSYLSHRPPYRPLIRPPPPHNELKVFIDTPLAHEFVNPDCEPKPK